MCHSDVQGHAPSPSYHADCESCHGPGNLHLESQEAKDIRFPANQDCEACHDTGHQHACSAGTMSEHNRRRRATARTATPLTSASPGTCVRPARWPWRSLRTPRA